MYSKYIQFRQKEVDSIRQNIYKHFKELYLPNLETIVLESCPYIVTLYSSIMHLKSLKNIKIVNCIRFIEKDLLVEQGYNFI